MGGIVKSIFGGGDMPAPPAPPPPPTDNSAQVDQAARESRARRLAGGRASTMLTGGEGVEDGQSSARKSLLGY